MRFSKVIFLFVVFNISILGCTSINKPNAASRNPASVEACVQFKVLRPLDIPSAESNPRLGAGLLELSGTFDGTPVLCELMNEHLNKSLKLTTGEVFVDQIDPMHPVFYIPSIELQLTCNGPALESSPSLEQWVERANKAMQGTIEFTSPCTHVGA